MADRNRIVRLPEALRMLENHWREKFEDVYLNSQKYIHAFLHDYATGLLSHVEILLGFKKSFLADEKNVCKHKATLLHKNISAYFITYLIFDSIQ